MSVNSIENRAATMEGFNAGLVLAHQP